MPSTDVATRGCTPSGSPDKLLADPVYIARCTLAFHRSDRTLTPTRGWCSADEYDRVLEVWQRMAKEAAAGSEVRPNTETCNTVIAAAACAGDLEAACDAYNYLIRHNLPVDVVRAASALPEFHPD